MTSSGERTPSQLTWLDRTGKVLGTIGDTVTQANIELSSDESQVLITRSDINDRNAVYLIDRARNDVTTRLADGAIAVFGPDRQQIAYSTFQRGLFTQPISGGRAKREYPGVAWPTAWFRHRNAIVAQSPDAHGDMDVIEVDLATGNVTPIVATMANEAGARLAPNEKWLAYMSEASSRAEVNLVSLDDTARKIQVSTAGGYTPRWRADGKELYFLTLDGLSLMAVDVSWSGTEPRLSKPVELFQTGELTGSTARTPTFGGSYYPSADGRRFLVARVQKRTHGTIDVIVNWLQTLSE